MRNCARCRKDRKKSLWTVRRGRCKYTPCDPCVAKSKADKPKISPFDYKTKARLRELARESIPKSKSVYISSDARVTRLADRQITVELTVLVGSDIEKAIQLSEIETGLREQLADLENKSQNTS